MIQDDFERWMVNWEKKKESTAYQYKRAINRISMHYSQMNKEKIDIYESQNISFVKKIADDYGIGEKYAEIGNEGNGTVRNAIATFVRFLEYKNLGNNDNFVENFETQKIQVCDDESNDKAEYLNFAKIEKNSTVPVKTSFNYPLNCGGAWSMKNGSVGSIIYKYLKDIINHCNNEDKDELDNLLDLDYSKKIFDLNYSFFIETKNINNSVPKKSSSRYIHEEYIVNNKKVRVTNDWYERNIEPFKKYLIIKHIKWRDCETVYLSNFDSLKSKENSNNSRYKGNAIGNAQNLLIRNILSNLGNESFSADDWRETKKYFGDRCAYCGVESELVMEHAIPINKKNLGEHRIGNTIPACKDCNNKKSDKDYKEFLGENLDAISKIEEYMASKNYAPLEDNEKLKNILNKAHEEVAIIANRYIDIINDLFVDKN